jgi:acylphosphatase
MGEEARARIVVSGRVQGVAFRQAAVDEAERLGGLSGWVQNLPDGRVELLAEGERPRVEALVAWCRRGPRFARVDEVEVGWSAPGGDLAPFAVAWPSPSPARG